VARDGLQVVWDPVRCHSRRPREAFELKGHASHVLQNAVVNFTSDAGAFLADARKLTPQRAQPQAPRHATDPQRERGTHCVKGSRLIEGREDRETPCVCRRCGAVYAGLENEAVVTRCEIRVKSLPSRAGLCPRRVEPVESVSETNL